uniref:Uncharacterized protein n=1 Tax=Micrurus lemniscatus lemniscatus TaxID=129467 RepID=A0A2D4JEM1_MICLE
MSIKETCYQHNVALLDNDLLTVEFCYLGKPNKSNPLNAIGPNVAINQIVPRRKYDKSQILKLLLCNIADWSKKKNDGEFYSSMEYSILSQNTSFKKKLI